MMTRSFVPDEVVMDILARLPAKPLVRCRCVSTHWNRLISEPSFMKSRARKSVILFIDNPFCVTETNVPTDDTFNSIQTWPNPVQGFVRKDTNLQVMIGGTFKGLVLLFHTHVFMLYNPLTGSFAKLPNLPRWLPHNSGYGFGYGATPDDLKIVRIKPHYGVSDIYCFKQGKWISRPLPQTLNSNIRFDIITGTFLNGFLYWMTLGVDMVIVVNLRDMVLSEMHLPFTKSGCTCLMGTMHGRLCLLKNKFQAERFEMWTLDIKSWSWSNTHSFKLALKPPESEGYMSISHKAVCILENGRILMRNPSNQLIIYDTSTDSCEFITFFPNELLFEGLRGMEYVESFLSPSDLCLSTI